jgi:hypothetical protein
MSPILEWARFLNVLHEFMSSVVHCNSFGQLGQLKLLGAWHDFQSPLQKNNFRP